MFCMANYIPRATPYESVQVFNYFKGFRAEVEFTKYKTDVFDSSKIPSDAGSLLEDKPEEEVQKTAGTVSVTIRNTSTKDHHPF